MDKSAIIMLNWNGFEDTIAAITSLKENYCKFDLYLVDNGSKQENSLKLEKWMAENCFNLNIFNIDDFKVSKGVNLIKSDINYGFAGANNIIATKIAPFYDTITLLNNDVEVTEGFVDSMYDTLKKHDLVAVTCDIRLFSNKAKLWNDGGKFTWYGDRKYYRQTKIDKLLKNNVRFVPAEFITGCCLMVDSQYILKYGLFSDKFFHGEEDFNFCLLAKKRNKVLGVDLSSRIYHKVGMSMNYNSNDIKYLNKIILHYSNRLVNYKTFYGKARWALWKYFYCSLIFIKNTVMLKSITKTWYVVKNVLNNSKLNDVRYDKFIDIINKEN